MSEEKDLLNREIDSLILQNRQKATVEEGEAPGEKVIGGVTFIPHTVPQSEDEKAVVELSAVESASKEGMTRLVESLTVRCDEYAALYRPWQAFLDTIEPTVVEAYPKVIERLKQRYMKATSKAENWATMFIMDVLGLSEGLDQEIPDY